MEQMILIEVCVDSVESAMAAEQGGADRVELCDNLIEGGTTPSAGMIKMAREHLDLGLQVIIRPPEFQRLVTDPKKIESLRFLAEGR
jgi:copper homeostasis protein